jgi:hypothetical protein
MSHRGDSERKIPGGSIPVFPVRSSRKRLLCGAGQPGPHEAH